MIVVRVLLCCVLCCCLLCDQKMYKKKRKKKKVLSVRFEHSIYKYFDNLSLLSNWHPGTSREHSQNKSFEKHNTTHNNNNKKINLTRTML